MKKTVVLFGSALLLMFAACNKKEKTQDIEPISTEVVEEDVVVIEGLTGSWELSEINTADAKGKTVKELYPGNLPSLTFENGLQVNGNDGCNNLMGSYDLGDNNAISIGEKLASTRMFCEGVADIAFNQALKETNNYSIDENTLVFKSNDNVVLKFNRVNAQ